MASAKRAICFILAGVIPLLSAAPTFADQWGSIVLAHCYSLDDSQYRSHFFVRVFWTELGGGQLYSQAENSEGPRSLHSLNKSPVSCAIDGRIARFETIKYRAPTMRGACGLCEQTGFRLTLDGLAVWEVPAPEERGEPIFNGTIDMDKDMVRICIEKRPEDLGVELSYEPDFFSSRTSVLVCKTLGL